MLTIVAAIGTLCVMVLGMAVTLIEDVPWYIGIYLLVVSTLAMLSVVILWKAATHD